MFDVRTLADLDALDAAALRTLLIAQQEQLSSRASEIEHLKLLVAKLQRMLFGVKSEKVLRQIEQLELKLEELEASTVQERRPAAVSKEDEAVQKPSRQPLPEHLPREVHTHMPDHEACPDCGGKTKMGRLWTYVRDDRPAGDTAAPAVWFAYSPDRKGERPEQHLLTYQGALQADAYSGFHHLYERGTIYEVACWAHARRKFHEIHIAQPSPTTAEALERIAASTYLLPLRSVMPRSSRSPRIWFTTAVRRITQRSRTRCTDCRSSCSSLLMGTKRMVGRPTTSAIASASM